MRLLLLLFGPLSLAICAQVSSVDTYRHDDGYYGRGIKNRAISGYHDGWFQSRSLSEEPTINDLVARTLVDPSEYARYKVLDREARERPALRRRATKGPTPKSTPPKGPPPKSPSPKSPAPQKSDPKSPAPKGGAQSPIVLYDPKNDPKAKAREEMKNRKPCTGPHDCWDLCRSQIKGDKVNAQCMIAPTKFDRHRGPGSGFCKCSDNVDVAMWFAQAAKAIGDVTCQVVTRAIPAAVDIGSMLIPGAGEVSAATKAGIKMAKEGAKKFGGSALHDLCKGPNGEGAEMDAKVQAELDKSIFGKLLRRRAMEPEMEALERRALEL